MDTFKEERAIEIYPTESSFKKQAGKFFNNLVPKHLPRLMRFPIAFK